MRTLAHREITMAQPGIPATPSDRRWLILSVVAVAQLMVVLDSTIAMPTRGYTLAFAVSAGVLGLGAILAVVLLRTAAAPAHRRRVDRTPCAGTARPPTT
jgi:hypothetical protein